LTGVAAALLPASNARASNAPGAPVTSPSAGAAPARATAFDREAFVDRCVRANRDGGQAAVREVLAQAVSDRGLVLAALPPTRAGMDVLHRSADLTVFAAAWTPQMNLPPHDHRMWALIGVYTGREDNIFWRRGDQGQLTPGGAKVLFSGDVASLPMEAIHSVTNPLQSFTGALHIYGGDFFQTPRSQWDPATLREERSDGDVIRAMFEEENARFLARTRCQGTTGA
jgi:predicted metal-dependent enzyme (double-stranded beta helix superfamily)